MWERTELTGPQSPCCHRHQVILSCIVRFAKKIKTIINNYYKIIPKKRFSEPNWVELLKFLPNLKRFWLVFGGRSIWWRWGYFCPFLSWSLNAIQSWFEASKWWTNKSGTQMWNVEWKTKNINIPCTQSTSYRPV